MPFSGKFMKLCITRLSESNQAQKDNYYMLYFLLSAESIFEYKCIYTPAEHKTTITERGEEEV